MKILQERMFDSLPELPKEEYNVNYELESCYTECFSDGATIGRNGKLGTVKEVGLGVYCPELKIYYCAKAKGISNNEAEFMALIRAMELLLERGVIDAKFYMDSKIIETRANRPFIKKMKPKHRNERMDNFQREVLELAEKFNSINFEWIPREQNTVADELSNQAK
jgi:ribonuclease H / adenosylcobalamin/alpha-ribazole phosphatase